MLPCTSHFLLSLLLPCPLPSPHTDVAVLVVDCRSAMLDSPANANQTRELGQLAAQLSANRTLVCAVNQMDTAAEAGAGEARYNAAVAAVAQLLRRRKEVRRAQATGEAFGTAAASRVGVRVRIQYKDVATGNWGSLLYGRGRMLCPWEVE